MAQTRNQRAGNASAAPRSLPLTADPSREHFDDLVAFFMGKRDVTCKAKAGTQVQGYEPGGDLSGNPKTLTIPPGGVARLIVEPPPAWNQDATQLALMVASGTLDIVDDKEFDGAKPHKERWREVNAAQLKRNMANGTVVNIEDQMGGLRAENAELKKRLVALESKK